MPPNRVKKQHFVPRFYLSKFADPEGFVWTYDKQSGSIRNATPENTGVETNFYSILGSDGEYVDDIEGWLNTIETRAAEIYPRVLRGERLSGADREDFSMFIASFFVRSPAMVNATAILYGKIAQLSFKAATSDRQRFEEMLDNIDREKKEVTSGDIRDSVYNIINSKEGFSLNVDRKIGLLTMDSAGSVANIIMDTSWVVVRPKDQYIITSDNPVVRMTPKEYVDPIYGDGGFMHEKMFITFPLSPDRILEMSWRKGDITGVHNVDKQRGKNYNRQRAGASERYLYANRRDSGVLALGVKHAKPGLRIGTNHDDELMKVEVKRKL